MTDQSQADTVFAPNETSAPPTEPEDEGRRHKSHVTLPPDLIREARSRLRLMTLLFAALFFAANFLQPLLMGQFVQLFASLARWLPGVISIAVALVMFGIASWKRVPDRTVLNIGLAWEVMGCYGIAFAQYWGIHLGIQYVPGTYGGFGLSWVAVWVLFLTIVVPNTPWKALIAAAASITSVPVVLALSIRHAGTVPPPDNTTFFFGTMFPYLLILVTTYVGARVIYRLGTDVTRARQLGSYRLIERIGAGGMGEVWKGSHGMLARPAAVKLIRPSALGHMRSDRARHTVKRFELEAQATAALSSPHTVSLYDFGVTDDGTFYYVMELLHGLDLDRLVDRFGPMPIARVVSILEQMCESLAEAHAKGLIHRDIKPANVYVCRVGDRFDFVKVLDFGLVKRDVTRVAGETQLTMADVAMGTPAYLPPEMARGGDVDARTDLYALGCVGYWLATGTLVFEGKSPLEVVSQHMRESPEPPSKRTELEVPEAFDSLILACLAKDPDDRPASARELKKHLRAVPCGAAWTDSLAARWWEQHLPDAVRDEAATATAASADHVAT